MPDWRQPDLLKLARIGDSIAGFAYHVWCPSGETEGRDPVVRAVLDRIARDGPLRPGERVDILRFFGGTRTHQSDPYALLAANVSGIIEMLIPVAWSVLISVESEHAPQFADYMAFTR